MFKQVYPYYRLKQAPWIVDVLQSDIRRGGFLGNREVARLGAPTGAVTASHNRGSHHGFPMALHFVKVVPNAIAAEHDPSSCDGW